MNDLDSPHPLSAKEIAQFRHNGFIKLREVLSPETVVSYREEITRMVRSLNRDSRPLEEKDTYGKAFIQIINIWKESAKVAEFVRGKRLAHIATQLLEVDGVRIHHDQALYKEASGGYTPWHVDQYYWACATDRTVTAWVPLQDTPLEMGPLCFSPESHRLMEGRSLKISDQSEAAVSENLKLKDFGIEESPYNLGDVSFHLGYCFHRAGPNTTGRPREVMTIAYMDKDMLARKPENTSQAKDLETLMAGARVGEVIDTENNPILYP